MKFQTISLVAGGPGCNARCPFCISKMTSKKEVSVDLGVNNRNLLKALTLAWRSGVNTAIITGKGEPLLYPGHVDMYIRTMQEAAPFPFIELQTNGSLDELPLN